MAAPLSTYRLQFNKDFRLKDAAGIIGYLDTLGASAVYASPIFKARAGSAHGYDIVDHNHLNPEIGTIEELAATLGLLKERAMGWVQDIVPNHMSYSSANTMLMDVMEKGRSSRYIGFFDIEWDHPYEGIRERVLAPFLGRIYGEALEAGEIRLAYSDAGLSVEYFKARFPLRIDSYHYFLTYGLRKLVFELGKEHPDFIKLLGILYVLKNLPAGEHEELDDQVAFVKRMLGELYSGNASIRKHVDGNIELFNGVPGDPESFNLMDRLLSEQVYKLSFWKVAAEEINYRRFFNINELISLRAEDEHVFARTHSLVMNLIGYGVTGLRVDHIDGLLDPLEYLERLREKAGGAYTVAEKILAPGEELPLEWPVDGTTGYDFLAAVNGLFCDGGGEERLTRTYASFTGLKSPCAVLFYEKKKLITEMDMMSDVTNLAQLLKMTLSSDRYGSDITMQGLKKAIVEVMAEFTVYRTYIRSEAETGVRRIKEAVYRAIGKNPALLNELTFLEKVLTLNYREYQSKEEKAEWLRFVMRFQQFTGPLMAKGVEDTLFYVYNRLISLNEVGSSPAEFGTHLEAFHSRMRSAAALRPGSMNATATHDTKRGEDARARINVISELPAEWERHVKKWSSLNRRKRGGGKTGPLPDKNDEYYFYQSLLGSFPFSRDEIQAFRERLRQHMIKAVREAKIHTAWLKPDREYEESFLRFIDGCLDEAAPNPFLESFLPFQRKVAWYGMMNSLSQTILKIACPGVPDFYQGTELWDLSMVDPDNRRPVDFGKRKALLDELVKRAGEDRDGLITELLANPRDGRVKLFVTHMALGARKAQPALFASGSYLPLEVSGEHSRSAVAFARAWEGEAAITVVPRFLTALVREGEYATGKKWGDTLVMLPEELQDRKWTDAFTGKRYAAAKEIRLSDGLAFFPAALLSSAGPSGAFRV